MRLERICQKMSEKDYRLTPQRQVILKIFLDNMDRHLSAEEVYQLVKKEHPKIGLATVYRTLDLLAELDVLQKMNFGDGRSRYELSSDEDTHHHHHLICLRCQRVLEFEDDLLEELEDSIEARSGFKIVNHQVKFYGYCRDCQEAQTPRF
ncbi:MAG: Fur family transcriptional regulator, ferric uptake regulator [Eubacteriales bacterium]|nr:Fur family transcriptional regulator, ferric uptake regulator [Eubacteriales bacterium]